MKKMATGIWNSIKAEGKEWRDAYKNRGMYSRDPIGRLGRMVDGARDDVRVAGQEGEDISGFKDLDPSLSNAIKKSFTSNRAIVTAGSAAAGGGAVCL